MDGIEQAREAQRDEWYGDKVNHLVRVVLVALTIVIDQGINAAFSHVLTPSN
jgi:hypothetical protein